MNDEQLNEDKFLRENILAEAALAATAKGTGWMWWSIHS